MFDKYEVGKGNSYNRTEVTVNEHRAATDESIRILKGMEEEINKKIVSMYTTESNELKAYVAVIDKNPMSREYTMSVSFRLNGKLFSMEVALSKKVLQDANYVDVIMKYIYDEVAKAIVDEIMKYIPAQLQDGGLPYEIHYSK